MSEYQKRSLDLKHSEKTIAIVEEARSHPTINILLNAMTYKDRAAARRYPKKSPPADGSDSPLDLFTIEHTDRVTDCAVDVAIDLGYSDPLLIILAKQSLLHDVGKMFVHSATLHNPGKPSGPELDGIRAHPVAGFKMLMGAGIPFHIGFVSLAHHDGYPTEQEIPQIIEEVMGRRIPIRPRLHQMRDVIRAADIADSLANDRPYRKAITDPELFRSECTKEFNGGDKSILDKVFQRYILPIPEPSTSPVY